jgi:aminoglycoside 3-N-acetyltransferase
LIQVLQRQLTESGTLLFPSFPFTGKQAAYVQRTRVFDVRKTASQVGLATEVFRRMPGVVRSWHPTHAFAGWGRHAAELLETHHYGGAFDATSPICRLAGIGGIVVGIGTGMRDSFTILHVPEETHPTARQRFFETTSCTMRIVNGNQEVPYELTPLRADVHRNYDRVERVLVREGILRKENVNGLRFTAAEARPFIDRCMRMIDDGEYL